MDTTDDHDTMVLNIEKGKSNYDTTIDVFVLYDYKDQVFLIRGKNFEDDAKSWMYQCVSMDRVYDLLYEIFRDCNDYFEINLFSIKNIPVCKKDITYDSLNEFIGTNTSSTITGFYYDREEEGEKKKNDKSFSMNSGKFQLERFKTYLRLLKTIYNKY